MANIMHRGIGASLLLWLLMTIQPVSALERPALDDCYRAFAYQGQTRHYLLRLPPGLPIAPSPGQQSRRQLPLVLVLHGGGGNAWNAEQMTGFTRKGRQAGFIVAYPEGTGRLENWLLTWNADHCCGQAMRNRSDDAGFIRALINDLVYRYPVDPRRIYITGLSNGGMMTHRLGIALSDQVAAIAPVVATLFGDEARPAHPVSVMIINGGVDQSVPPAGGAPGGRGRQEWDSTPLLPAAAQGDFWARVNGCRMTPAFSHQQAIQQWQYACPEGVSVVRYLVDDNGHAWPGGQSGSRRGDTPSTAMQATDQIWDFFAAHPKK